MKILEQLFASLGDGRFHSGARLSEQLQVSRSSIWNGIEQLKAMGLEIYAVKGQGYKLAEPVEPLDKERILQAITPEAKLHLPHLDVLWSLDSTNRYLMDLAKYGAQSGHACLAEIQTAGRGRRGRSWVSPFGGNVYLSQLWRFQAGPSMLGGLSLAVAVAVARALAKTGVQGFALKWPNDIISAGKKLAGILLEISGEATGPAAVVCGVGINVLLNRESARSIDQPWTDLYHMMGAVPSRNRLVGALISELTDTQTRVILVNLSASEKRAVIVQGGAYGEHQLEAVAQNGRTTRIDSPTLTVHLDPGSGETLVFTMRRFANTPTALHPWHRTP